MLVVPVVSGVVVGGFGAGVFGASAGFIVYDLVFIPPYFTLSVGRSENWVVLVVYVAVMLLVASVVARLETARSRGPSTRRGHPSALRAHRLLIEDRPLSEILELIVSTVHDAFALRSVALLLPGGDPAGRGGVDRRAAVGGGTAAGRTRARRSPPAWGIPATARPRPEPRRWRSPPRGAPSGCSISGARISADTTRICCTPSPITWPSPSSGPSSGSRPCAPSCSRRSTVCNGPWSVRCPTTCVPRWRPSRRRRPPCAAPTPT